MYFLNLVLYSHTTATIYARSKVKQNRGTTYSPARIGLEDATATAGRRTEQGEGKGGRKTRGKEGEDLARNVTLNSLSLY